MHAEIKSSQSNDALGTYLAALNVEQRRAVEHGCGALEQVAPLLIIAGAGSGKTNTLAHRVAHLIVFGRRSAAHDAADLLAPRCSRDAASGRAYHGEGAGAEKPA